MAINSKKISGLNTLSELTGEEYLMVAYNNKSYKVKTSLLTADIITSIVQKVNTGDGADNPITITTSGGSEYTFSVKNGAKGSTGDQGPQGKKGETGDAAVALYNTDVDDLILDTVNGKSVDGKVSYTAEELTQMILSARQGKLLNDRVNALAEEYISQDEYDALNEAGSLDANTKYFIVDTEA